MQLFSKTIRSLWNGWEIRVLVLLSLSLQIILILFGSQRKYIARSWVRMLVWSAYLTADWVATVALGNLATNQGDCKDNSPEANNQLQAFWAPFLLLHLGGPDTITAYSLEDNELWLRHFLGLGFQVGVASYVLVLYWTNNALTFTAIPIFVSGIIKYGERTFVLWSSSAEHSKESLLSSQDLNKGIIEVQDGDIEELRNKDSQLFIEAYYLFKRSSKLFAGLILSYDQQKKCYNIFAQKTVQDAFSLVEIELGYIYDMLYTKAPIVYSQLGAILRCISFFSSFSALVAFFFFINRHAYSLIDISITYLLLLGAVALEFYSIVLHLFSDWVTLVTLMKFKNPLPIISSGTDRSLPLLIKKKRWSRTMGQFNLISYCTKSKSDTFTGVQSYLLCFNKYFEKYLYCTWEDVTVALQEMIIGQLEEMIPIYKNESVFNDIELRKRVLARRGDYVLKEKYRFGRNFDWCTVEAEFDSSLLLWHIATDFCHASDLQRYGDGIAYHPKCKISRCISDYMSYLLILRPSMLPKGIAELRYNETCQDAMNIFGREEVNPYCISTETFEEILSGIRGIAKDTYGGDNRLSLLVSGHSLAKQLLSLTPEVGWTVERRWEMICQVWIEMLAYAANHCEWKEHAQQLRKGGELLTHVRLFTSHLGLSEQYRIYSENIF